MPSAPTVVATTGTPVLQRLDGLELHAGAVSDGGDRDPDPIVKPRQALDSARELYIGAGECEHFGGRIGAGDLEPDPWHERAQVRQDVCHEPAEAVGIW